MANEQLAHELVDALSLVPVVLAEGPPHADVDEDHAHDEGGTGEEDERHDDREEGDEGRVDGDHVVRVRRAADVSALRRSARRSSRA
jgi:hypothetical protein